MISVQRTSTLAQGCVIWVASREVSRRTFVIISPVTSDMTAFNLPVSYVSFQTFISIPCARFLSALSGTLQPMLNKETILTACTAKN